MTGRRVSGAALCVALCLVASHAHAAAGEPNCGGKDHWAAGAAYSVLKNQGLIVPDQIDHNKTMVLQLASQNLGWDKSAHAPLYRQVYDVTFVDRAGHTIEAITVNDASTEECSMTGVNVYIVSKPIIDPAGPKTGAVRP